MKTLMKCYIVLLIAILVSSCDFITTRDVASPDNTTINENGNGNQGIDEPIEQKPPYDYSKELKERLKNEHFACSYQFISDVCVKELNEPIGWRRDINYNDKISFGYANKIKDSYDKCVTDRAGQVRVYINLDKIHNELINQWLISDNLSYTEADQMLQEWNQLVESGEFEQAYYLQKEMEAYDEKIELSIEQGYSKLLSPYFNGQFSFNQGNFIGVFSDLDECNEYMEAINQICSNDYVLQVSVLYDFGELVSKELWISYYVDYYANLKKFYEEQGIIDDIVIDPYGENVHYVGTGFIFVEGESWVAWFFHDTDKLQNFMPLQ